MQIERQEARVFLAVVAEGGFSRAADALHVSQSAVSQTIANLEHKLGTQLLRRGSQPVPTEAGQRLLRYAEMIAKEERETLTDIQQIRTGALSTLSLAVNSMVNRCFARELLLEYCDQNPLTRLKLNVVPSKEIISGVIDGRWELGFGPFQNRMPGQFNLRPLLDEQRVLVVHESHPQFQALTHSPVDLLGETTLLTSYLDDGALSGGGQRLRDAFRSVWEISNLRMRLALAEAGKGLLYLSDHLLPQLDGLHEVTGLPVSRIPRAVGIYHQKHKPLSEGAKRFVAICERRFPVDG
ncbi:MAG: LysR family transcriptional regulator [Pseudomonadota bacterium]